MEFKNKISLIVGGIVGSITSFYANLDTIMQVLILFMIIDFVLGIVDANNVINERK